MPGIILQAARAGAKAGAASMSGGLAQSIFAPAARGASMRANEYAPNNPPALNNLLDGYFKGVIGYDLFLNEARKVSAAAFVPTNRDGNNGRVWQELLESYRPGLGLGLITHLRRQGFNFNNNATARQNETMSPASKWRYLLAQSGISQAVDTRHFRGLSREDCWNIADEILNLKAPLAPELALSLARYWGLGEDWFAEQCRLAGVIDSDRIAKLWGQSQPLTLGEMIELTRRGTFDVAKLDSWLPSLGLVHPDTVSGAHELLKNMPSISDLITFAVKEVWNPEVVQTFGYDLEFPEEFRHWAAKQGLDWSEPTPTGRENQTSEVTWPRAYWRAHWRPMSPEQAATARQRLRPGRMNRYGLTERDAFELSEQDFVLKTADYPPNVRRWLTAISYRPMGRRQLRIATRNDPANWTVDRLTESLQDLGLNPADAHDEATVLYKDGEVSRSRDERLLLGQARRAAIRGIRDLFWIGALSHATTINYLMDRGFTEANARTLVGHWDSEKYSKRVQAQYKCLKRNYDKGEVNDSQAIARLAELGWEDQPAARQVADWRNCTSTQQKQASKSEVLRWLQAGHIDAEDAKARLENLGVPDPDLAVLASTVLDRLRDTEAKIERANSRRSEGRAREYDKLITMTARMLKRLQADLKRSSPLARIKRDAQKGRVSNVWVRRRLYNIGYTKPQIDRLLVEWSIPQNGEA